MTRFVRFRSLILTIVIFSGLTVPKSGAAASTPTISVQSSVSNSTLTIGDKITYTLKVVHSPSLKVTLPAVGANLGEFEIKDFNLSQSQETDEGLLLEQQEFILTTFTVGDYIIPPVTVSYQDEKGARKEIKSEQIFLKVASVKKSVSDKEDIRPDKAPQDEAFSDWYYYALGLLLAAIFIAFLLYYHLKRQQQKLATAPATPLPPYEWAQQRLAWLKEQRYLENNQVKEHYDCLSDLIREYLERLYQLPLLDRTTLEIYFILRELQPLRSHLTMVSEFLKESDLVKFAKYVPEAKVNEELWQTAVKIVEELKPQENSPVGGVQ